MLGTGTVYTPTLKNKKKVPVKAGDKLQEYYPKGETLSLVSMLVNTNNPVADQNPLVPYHSPDIAVVNGPKNEGTDVGEKIGIGLGIALNALVRGQTELNEIAHSRGGVESILIAHEINAIKEAIPLCEDFEHLIKELTRQQTERHKGKPTNNTPDIIKSLLTQLPQSTAEREQWFQSLKTNISDVSMNLFIIDPVPGDPFWPITWYDSRFYTIPPVVKYAEVIYYENEHSDWGFTPIYPEASDPKQQVVIRNTLPGHHGTGSSGSNASQQSMVVSPDKTKSTHVQKLMIFKLLHFLLNHGVEFKDAQEIFHKHTGLGRKYLAFLEGVGINENIDIAKLDFPTIFRTLYDKIYANRAAYEAFNTTHYTGMGVAPQRKVLRTDHKYGLLTEIFPKNIGYVNEEHSVLMKEFFFKIFHEPSQKDQTILELIQSAHTVLSKNIKVITNLSSSVCEHQIAPAAILDSESARKDVLSSFGTLIQRVSQQYLMDDWSSEKKQIEKEGLFVAIIDLWAEFAELAKSENQTIQVFVASLIDLTLNGISQTVAQQHANLDEKFNRLSTPTDANLRSFFNTLLTQLNKEGAYSDFEIQQEINQIFTSLEFAQLADHPITIKIEYICKQLKEKLPQIEIGENLVEQFVTRFEENYGSSFDEFEKLYHQIGIFINDAAALGRQFKTAEAVFNKHELSLRKKAEALIDVAAQKFYRDRPNALPEPAEKGTFKELVERHAINTYGVVDRLKQKKAHLEEEKEHLSARIKLMEQQIAEKEQIAKETNASLESERAKKIEYHSAMNNDKEAEYLLLINKKLVPLTKEYLAFLDTQLSHRPPELEKNDEIKEKDDKVNSKIRRVTKLYEILTDTNKIPHPKDRLHSFYTKLDRYENQFIAHHDPDWVTFRRNLVIAAGVLLTLIVPGLIALAIYANVGHSSVKSCYFWRSSGQNAVTSFNRYRAAADIPIAVADKDKEEGSSPPSMLEVM